MTAISTSANPDQDLKATIARIADGAILSADEAEAAFDVIMSGNATPAQIGAFLVGLRVRGETVDEIAAAAKVMRAKATKVDAPAGAMDTCGTGGDGAGTYNISTAVAFVLAAHDIPIAKHGNRALSSKSGTSQVLEALGVNLDVTPEQVSHCVREAGIGFMFAPAHHSAMKHVGPIRVELGIRTIFNLLGPLSNPAGAPYQLLGVFASEWTEPLAHVLNNLGSTAAWVVHGSDGLDELTTTGPSHVSQLKDGKVTNFTITPEDAGLPLAQTSDLVGGDPAHNAAALTKLLDGEKNAYRDIVLLNAAAGLIVAGKASDLKDGAAKAAAAIDNGSAKARLAALVTLSNEGK